MASISSSSNTAEAVIPTDAPIVTHDAACSTEPVDCAICLDTVKIAGSLDSCTHLCCFDCIVRWSKVTNKCPVCSRKFLKIVEKNLNPDEILLDAAGKKKRKRKPRTVKVLNKDQQVSYDHTGTFNGSSDDSEDDDDDFMPDYNVNPTMFNLIVQTFANAMYPSDATRSALLSEQITRMPSLVRVGRRQNGVVDLTVEVDSDETIDLACVFEDDSDATASVSSRRERRGHSLFDQVASRHRPIAEITTISGTMGSSRGARAAAAVSTGRRRLQPLRRGPIASVGPAPPTTTSSTRPGVPSTSVAPSSSRGRRSFEIIELSDSDSDSDDDREPVRNHAASESHQGDSSARVRGQLATQASSASSSSSRRRTDSQQSRENTSVASNRNMRSRLR